MAILKKSVSTLLLLLMTLLAVGGLTSTAQQMHTAFTRYRDSLETSRFATADKAVFQGVLTLRTHRGDVQSALLTLDDPRTRLDELMQVGRAGYDAVAAAMDSVEFAGRDEYASTLRQRWSEVNPLSKTLFDEGLRPRAERKLERINSWYDGVAKIIEPANLASIAISNRAWMNDPFIARMVQVRRLAWQIRDRYGLQCSAVRQNVNSSKPLDESQKLNVAQWNGVVGAGWSGLDDLLVSTMVGPDLIAAAKSARASTDAANQKIAQLLQGLDGSGRPAMSPQEWNTLCLAPFGPIVAIATKALDESITHAEAGQTTARGSLVAQSIGFLLALLVTSAGIFVVRNRLVRPVRILMGAIAKIGERDYVTSVPQFKYSDEFGTMAVALESLRNSAAMADKLAEERQAQQSLQIARSNAVDTACRQFDDTVQAVIQGVSGSAKQLDQTATEMHALTSDSSNQTAAVATAAEQATNNLETIAAATEELSASVAEISGQVQGSAREAREAVALAEQTNATVEELDQTATRIGEVVKMINAIAAQTNLLALNATIEAARAGEAGRGFAVVASEVKGLAAQTATATEDITRQVNEIQAATGQAVSAIRSIGRAIGGIDEKMTAVAAAVEEQRAATTEISRNFQQAAQGTRGVTETIGNVAALNRETGNAGAMLFESVKKMSSDADCLRAAVEGFLGSVRAA